MKHLILIGGGGHCRSVIDIIKSENKFQIKAITDQKKKIGQQVINNYEITNEDRHLPELIAKYKYCLITIGQLKNADLRINLFNKAKNAQAIFPIIVSPYSTISPLAQLGEGSVVLPAAVVNSNSSIGCNCIINTGSIVEHDVQIGDHTHIAPGAIIGGHCQIGNKTLIGSGCVLLQDIKIADEVIIGAGSTVISSIEDSGIYVGSPAKKIG